MKNDSACAVVVTYNRKNLLLECLEALKNQSKTLDAIYLIDNASTDGTGEFLLEKGYIEELPDDNPNKKWNRCYNISNLINEKIIKFYYIQLNENTGGAGGFHEGVKRAYEDGYDWLWLMDDDSEPLKDSLEKLTNYFDEKNVSALASVVKSVDNKIVPLHRKVFDFKSLTNFNITKTVDPELIDNNKVLKIDDASFVGLLVNRRSIKKIGFPKKKFFIHSDDTEYSIRLRSVGEILIITDSVIQHKTDFNSSKYLKKSFLGRTFYRVKYKNYWLNYYAVRNNVWLLKKYRKPMPFLWIILLFSWLVSASAIILFDDHKFRRMKFLTSAYSDGLKNHFDNKKPKRILYN